MDISVNINFMGAANEGRSLGGAEMIGLCDLGFSLFMCWSFFGFRCGYVEIGGEALIDHSLVPPCLMHSLQD